MTVVIAMWSGPRNISTTMMRSFGARSDTLALDEPFYAEYLARTGADHPYRRQTLEKYPNDFDGVLEWIAQARGREILFLKNIAYHLGAQRDFAFLDGWRNFILIRDPRAMVASFSAKFDDVTPIVESYAVSIAIRDRLTARGLACPVVDAADILADPPAVLGRLCAALGIDFDPAMQGWAAGAKPEDGPWAPHWYEAVNASTGFRPAVEKKLNLSAELAAIAERALPAYQNLAADRL